MDIPKAEASREHPFVINSDQDNPLPAVIETKTALTAGEFNGIVSREREWIIQQLHVHGAILFKGFDQDLDSFGSFMEAMFPHVPPFMSKVAGIFSSKRKVLKRNVVESTYLGKRLPMNMHNEFYYMPHFPRYFCLRCIVAPTEGGETGIADCRKIYQEIRPEIRDRFESEKVKYTRNLHNDPWNRRLINRIQKIDESWPEVFGTDSKQQVEETCRESATEFRWGENDKLRLVNTLPAVRIHPATNEKVWFNSASTTVYHPKTTGWMKSLLYRVVYPSEHSIPFRACFGDGSEISPEDALHINEVVRRNTVLVKWTRGETLLCDNLMVGHTRMPYRGERLLATALRG